MSSGKKEMRPLVGSAPVGLAVAPAPRGGSLCIGLLIVAICLQLYVISLWMAPAQAPVVSSRELVGTGHGSDPISLTSAALAAIHAERRVSSEVNKLSDSEEALTALHLLSKYIRTHRNKLDASGGVVQVMPDASHPEGPLRTDVGQGLVLGGEKHDDKGDGHTHAAGESHEHHAGDTHDEDFLKKRAGLYQSIWLNISSSWAADQLRPDRHHDISDAEKERRRQCLAWVEEYGIKVDVTWGTTPPADQVKFDAMQCSDVVSADKTARFILDYPEKYNRVLPVSPSRQKVRAEPGMEDKVIATVVCMTTRSLKISKPEDLALFKDLLPSFVRTVEPGFEYWFYLGYDIGDPWLDNAENLKMLSDWFSQHVSSALAKKSIVAKLVFSSFVNGDKKPGPVFNHVTGVAYADGATWIYRINDDQRFESPWAHAFVDALTAMGPPYGVVGPACGQGNTAILVVDFTHRTHHEIFPTHYPPTLAAWWMDNWISQVYGRKRTLRVNSAKITHLTGSHGTRYEGMFAIGGYLRGEIIRGRVVFEEYLSHTPGMKEQLESYRADSFSYGLRR